MTTTPSASSGRGIESIAHHFLSQAAPSQQPFLRRSPRERFQSESIEPVVPDAVLEDIQKQPSPEAAVIDQRTEFENTSVESDREVVPVRIVLMSGDSHFDEESAGRYAVQTAYHNGRVGLLRMGMNNVEMIEYDSCLPPAENEKPTYQKPISEKDISLDDEELRALLESIDPGDDIKEQFHLLTDSAETLLFQVDPHHGDLYELIIKTSDVVVLMTHTDSDSLIETYRNLKWLANDLHFEGDISLYIADEDSERMEAAYGKLAKTARQFLKIELGEAEFPLPYENISQKVLYEHSADQQTLCDLQCLLAGEKCSQINNKKPIKPTKEGQAIKISTSVSRKKTVFCPLAVSAFPVSDRELTETLASSASVWLKEIEGPVVLSIPMPKSIDPAVKLLVDTHGRCHILLADYQPDDLLLRACAVRQWLTDHLPLIHHACPNMKIDETLAPGIILVAAGDIESLKRTVVQFENLPIQIKQLILLDDGQSKSLLVM